MDIERSDFWQSSRLTKHNLSDFAAQITKYGKTEAARGIDYSFAPTKLRHKSTKLSKITARRHSDRNFSEQMLTTSELGKLMSPLWDANTGHAPYPAAGAIYSAFLYLLIYSVSGVRPGLYYVDQAEGGLARLGDAPDWTEVSANINMGDVDQSQIFGLITVNDAVLNQKYGLRGQRFALIEAGALMQQLSLSIAETKKLHGVCCGGVMDDYWEEMLSKFNITNQQIVMGMMIGK